MRATLTASALLCALLSAATPSVEAAGTTTRYDVLGDSYAAGYGVLPHTDCGRSQAAYGVLLDGRAGLSLDDLVACPRESTTSMVEAGQLDALDADTDLVLLSVGANDMGWGQPAVACLLRSNAECAQATQAANARTLEDLPALLDTLHEQITAAVPAARVIVTGYPRLFTPRYGVHLNASPIEQKRLNDGTDLLNQEAHAAAARHGFDFVDVTARFAVHGMNAPDPWIYTLRDANGDIDRRAFHPNEVGHQAYARAVIVTYRG